MADKKIFLTALIATLFTLVLGGLFFSLYAGQKVLDAELTELRSELSDEKDTRTTILKKMDLNQQLLFRNLNESRKVLQLPGTKAVPIFQEGVNEGEQELSGSGHRSGDEEFFRGVRFFSEFYLTRELARKMENLLKSDSIKSLLREQGLSLEQKEKTVYLLRQIGEDRTVKFLLQGRYDSRLPMLQISSLLQKEISLPLDRGEGESGKDLEDFLKGELERIENLGGEYRQKAAACEEIISGDDIKKILTRRDLKIEVSDKNSAGTSFIGEIKRLSEGENPSTALLRFGVRYPANNFFVGSETYGTGEDFAEGLVKKLRSIDTRTEQELAVDKALDRLKKLAGDQAFLAYLEEQNLEMSDVPREDGDYFYFDLFEKVEDKKDGNEKAESKFGAFAVLKKYGEFYLTDEEDIVISSLRAVDSASRFGLRNTESFFRNGEVPEISGEKTMPETAAISNAGNSDDTIILLCGTHEKNADTIMIARMAEGRIIRLLSIPRDIYYHGRKLNTHYRTYGMERLKDILGELTGLEFDGYISVDMYAFIDVINLLKGIEVTLEEALIDPTYRVRENGEWTTLYYPAGTHLLSGIEALRVVRSRHTSDDFDRSYRQQIVLKALLERLNKVHAGKLKEIYDLFQILYRYVETDLSAYDLVQYYLRYHEAAVEPGKSVSTDNILYTTYSNLYYAGLSEDEVNEDFYKGAWILLPKDDNWQLIESFVRAELYGD